MFACEKEDSNKQNDEDKTSSRDSVSGLEADLIWRELNSAYNDNSTDYLNEIFDYWYNEIHPTDTSQINYSVLADYYHIYNEFYTPWVLGRIAQTTDYAEKSYLVVQTKLPYRFTSEIERIPEWFADTINNFKPEPVVSGLKYLYLSENYKEALFLFITLNEQPAPEYIVDTSYTQRKDSINFGEITETTEIAYSAQTAEISGVLYSFETELTDVQHIDTTDIIYPQPSDTLLAKWDSRIDFLDNYVSLAYFNRNNYWNFTTMPEVTGISLDTAANKAMVFYHFINEKGKAYYEKNTDKWNLLWFRKEWE